MSHHHGDACIRIPILCKWMAVVVFATFIHCSSSLICGSPHQIVAEFFAFQIIDEPLAKSGGSFRSLLCHFSTLFVMFIAVLIALISVCWRIARDAWKRLGDIFFLANVKLAIIRLLLLLHACVRSVLTVLRTVCRVLRANKIIWVCH